MQTAMTMTKPGAAFELPGSLSQNCSRARHLARPSLSAAKVPSRGVLPVRAVSEKDKVITQFSRLASDAASSLRQVTDRALDAIPPQDVLQHQAEATAAELRQKAELLRRQALQASSQLTGIIGRTEEERSALLRRSNTALFSAAGQLRTSALVAQNKMSTLLQEAEKNKGKLLEVVQAAPEPIKDIAETAVVAHSPEAARKGAVIHDFCLGITFGGALVAGGIVWFIATGSINAIRFGFLLGGILLAAAIGSLNAWRAGKSSNPYIAVQGVTAYLLFARETFRYYQTQALFPTAIVATASLAMVAFYVYVVLAGGNPPSKKAAAA